MEQVIYREVEKLDYNLALAYERDINIEQIKTEMLAKAISELENLVTARYNQEAVILRAEGDLDYKLNECKKYRNSPGATDCFQSYNELRVQYITDSKKLSVIEKKCEVILKRIKEAKPDIINKVYALIDAYNPDDKKRALELDLKMARIEYTKILKQLFKCIEYYNIACFICNISKIIDEDMLDGELSEAGNEAIRRCKPLLNRLEELNSFVLMEGNFYEEFKGNYTVKSARQWDKVEDNVRQARVKLTNAITNQIMFIKKHAEEYYEAYNEMMDLSDVALAKFRSENASVDSSDEDMTYLQDMIKQADSQIIECESKISEINEDKKLCEKIMSVLNQNYKINDLEGVEVLFEEVGYISLDFNIGIGVILTLILGAIYHFIMGKREQDAYNQKVNEELPKHQDELDLLQKKYPSLLFKNDDFIANNEIKEPKDILEVFSKLANMKDAFDEMTIEYESEKKYLEKVKKRIEGILEA